MTDSKAKLRPGSDGQPAPTLPRPARPTHPDQRARSHYHRAAATPATRPPHRPPNFALARRPHRTRTATWHCPGPPLLWAPIAPGASPPTGLRGQRLTSWNNRVKSVGALPARAGPGSAASMTTQVPDDRGRCKDPHQTAARLSDGARGGAQERQPSWNVPRFSQRGPWPPLYVTSLP